MMIIKSNPVKSLGSGRASVIQADYTTRGKRDPNGALDVRL